MSTTLLALYDEVEVARKVAGALLQAGFEREAISLTAYEPQEAYAAYREVHEAQGQHVEVREPSIFGVMVGAVAGLLVSVDFILSGGGAWFGVATLVTAVLSVGVGAGIGGLIGLVVSFVFAKSGGRSPDQVEQQGGSLVIIRVAPTQVVEAREIMDDYDPLDLEESVAQRLSEESGMASEEVKNEQTLSPESGEERPQSVPAVTEEGVAEQSGSATPREERDAASSEVVEEGMMATVEVVEEEVSIGKREVEKGGVRVHVQVVEEPVERDVQLRDEHVYVERRAVDRPLEGSVVDAFQEQTIELVETAEEIVVDRETRVVEEVVVHREMEEHVERVRTSERHTEVEIEALDETDPKDEGE